MVSYQVRRNWVPILAWIAIVTYFLISPNLYYKWFIEDGKSIASIKDLPPESLEFKSYIDQLSSYDTLGTYELVGWAFLMNDDFFVEDYEREIVFMSESKSYVFLASSMRRADVNEHFKSLGKNLTMSGFRTLVSINALKPGNYRILIFFKQQDGNSVFVDTNRCISRTPNFLLLNEINSPKCQ